MNFSILRSSSILLLVPASLMILTACGGPRTIVIDEREYDQRPPGYPIPIYDGPVLESHREIAMVESRGYETDTEETRDRMYAELKRKARSMGGDAVQNVRTLTKQIKGYTVDERTPFLSWKQGNYPLYFMRGQVITYESGLPGAVATGDGFVEGVRGYIPPGSEDDEKVVEKKPKTGLIKLPRGITIREEPLSKSDMTETELEETPALDELPPPPADLEEMPGAQPPDVDESILP